MLNQFPIEIQAHIFQYLTLDIDVKSVRLVSKEFKDTIELLLTEFECDIVDANFLPLFPNLKKFFGDVIFNNFAQLKSILNPNSKVNHITKIRIDAMNDEYKEFFDYMLNFSADFNSKFHFTFDLNYSQPCMNRINDMIIEKKRNKKVEIKFINSINNKVESILAYGKIIPHLKEYTFYYYDKVQYEQGSIFEFQIERNIDHEILKIKPDMVENTIIELKNMKLNMIDERVTKITAKFLIKVIISKFIDHMVSLISMLRYDAFFEFNFLEEIDVPFIISDMDVFNLLKSRCPKMKKTSMVVQSDEIKFNLFIREVLKLNPDIKLKLYTLGASPQFKILDERISYETLTCIIYGDC